MPEMIEIDDQILELLKSEAEPFVDTPNSVLRRLLSLDGSQPVSKVQPGGVQIQSLSKTPPRKRKGKAKNTRAAAGTLLPLEEYRMPILKALARSGRAPSREVIEEVGVMLAERLTSADRDTIESGGLRWQNRTQFARLRLVQEGLMKKDSPRGIWEISPEGQKLVGEEGSTEFQIQRALQQAGEPLHIRRIREALGTGSVELPEGREEAHLLQTLRQSERFARTGRGTYGLTSWGLETSKPGKRKTVKRAQGSKK